MIKTEETENKRFVIEEHPLLGFLIYLIIMFFAQYFIQDAILSVCLVDVIFFVWVLIRRLSNPIKRSQYNEQIETASYICVFIMLITAYCWSKWYMTNIADNLSVEYVNSNSKINPFIYLIMVSIIAPLGEESVFRYIIGNGFMKSFSKFKPQIRYFLSILLSSFIFAIVHGTGVHLLVGMFCGIALSIAYFVTNNLWVSIVVHSLYNLGTLFVRVPSSLLLCIVLTIVCVVLLVLTIKMLCKSK